MLVVSFKTLIQEVIAPPGYKQLSGQIQSTQDLFKPESLALLEDHHRGLFAFLAFHPAVDLPIVEYLRQGALASDSGPNILTLFTLDENASFPTSLTSSSFGEWLDLDASIHPSYQLVRILFEPRAVPPLPGVAFFTTFTGRHEAVYVDLQGLADATQVRNKLRGLFSGADQVFRESQQSRKAFSDKFALQLQQNREPFVKSGPTSMREWLVRSYQYVGDHLGDIVSVISTGASLA